MCKGLQTSPVSSLVGTNGAARELFWSKAAPAVLQGIATLL